MPAHGIYLRHMEDVTINDVNIVTAQPNARPVLKAVDVTRLRVDGKAVTEGEVPGLPAAW